VTVNPYIIKTISMISLLTAVLSNASEYAETNKMPVQIHTLMKSEGFGFNPRLSCISELDTHSLRHYAVIDQKRFQSFELTPKKKAWSFWDNSNIKSLRRNNETAVPYFTQFEYDIYYPFYF